MFAALLKEGGAKTAVNKPIHTKSGQPVEFTDCPLCIECQFTNITHRVDKVLLRVVRIRVTSLRVVRIRVTSLPMFYYVL